MHEVIVVGVDGSPGGYAAVAEAAELAKRFDARLVGISVQEGFPRYAATKIEADEFIREKDRYFAEVGKEARALAGRHGIVLEHVTRIGDAARVIVKFAAEVDADLVVLGYKRHSRIAQFVSGATAQKVGARTNASVLVVKPEWKIAKYWVGGHVAS
ncbi:MAG TPA: universal stress protein [Thermomicrobiaceae bacterium]|nr:universal stress protein [Thermomicrobiaceae bacterium]